MANLIHVTPRKGFKIVDPDTRAFLAAEGEERMDTLYWRALERDGDVTIKDIPAEDSKKQPVAASDTSAHDDRAPKR